MAYLARLYCRQVRGVTILLKIILVPADLGHLPPRRDLFKIMLLEEYKQSVEAEAGVEVTLLAVRAQ